MNETELLFKLFSVVEEFVLSAGGDGDGWIISKRYKELADLFEVFESSNDRWFVRVADLEGVTSFENEHEAILFIDDSSKLPTWAGDIVVKIY